MPTSPRPARAPRPARLPNPPVPAHPPARRWPGFAVWAALLAGAWIERLVVSMPFGMQSLADLGLTFGTAAFLMLAFRAAARQRVSARRAPAATAPSGATQREARAPDSA